MEIRSLAICGLSSITVLYKLSSTMHASVLLKKTGNIVERGLSTNCICLKYFSFFDNFFCFYICPNHNSALLPSSEQINTDLFFKSSNDLYLLFLFTSNWYES